MKKIIAVFLFIILVLPSCVLAASPEKSAEVIHWWVSGGESAAVDVLIKSYREKGYSWLDTPVEDSYQAKSAALTRILDNKPPTMVQWQAGVSLRELDEAGLLSDISKLADSAGWRDLLPEVILQNISIADRVVAVPMTLHGSNWLFGNRAILQEIEAEMPKSWGEFLAMAPEIQKLGYIPLAFGGQPWQERNLFLSVLLGTAGKEMYLNTIVQHDLMALKSPEMIRVFEVFRSLQQFVDNDSPGRGWAQSTALLIDGKAAFQVMGDWAKGEFVQAGMEAGKDYLCSLSPGAQENFLAVSDAFVVTKVNTVAEKQAQAELVKTMMDKEVQRSFNLLKGAIPPRLDVNKDGFDECARLAMDIVQKKGSVLPGFNMANTGALGSTIRDGISIFWNDKRITPVQGAELLAAMVEEAMGK